MGLKGKIKETIKHNYVTYCMYYMTRYKIPSCLLGNKWDVIETRRKFKRTFGREIDLDHPRTLNEKIQWLKLNDHDKRYTILADKFAVREYWRQFGEDGLIPLLYRTEDWKQITTDILPDEPCIVKCNTGSGDYWIIHDKSAVDIRALRNECRRWMVGNYYIKSQEWQYKDIRPCILVERLLLDKNGHIPNDYKLHFINGELQFVYCSIDREGKNYRNIYTPDWQQMNVEWVEKEKHGKPVGDPIPAPKTFAEMVRIGSEIAKGMRYVRVDFYDVDGKLYYGEITLHHGSGYDTFEPEKWDLIYGEKLKI